MQTKSDLTILTALRCVDIENEDRTTITIADKFTFGLSQANPAICTQIANNRIRINSSFGNTAATPLGYHDNENDIWMTIAATKNNLEQICYWLQYTHFKGLVGRSEARNSEIELTDDGIKYSILPEFKNSWISITCFNPGIHT